MNCEKHGGPYDRLSLIDGSVEHVHFVPAEEVLASIPQVEPKLVGTCVKRPFVPIGGLNAEDLLGR